MPAYPRGFLTTLWFTLVLVFVTGIVLIPGALELRLDLAVPARLPGGSRIVAAAAHALGAFLLLVVIGALIPLHIRSGLRRRTSIVTGITLLALLAILAISALAIYYVSAETLSAWSSVVHLIAGLAMAVPLTVHAVKGRRIRKQRTLGL